MKCLYSTGYPNNYDNNFNERQTFSAPPGQPIQISFMDFEVEEEPTCDYDYVEFSDEDGKIIGPRFHN